MKKILSCDGGGVRGAATARFLLLLERALGKSLYDTFDLFAGTSTGGLIVLGLAVNRMTGEQVDQIYNPENANRIFSKDAMDDFIEEIPWVGSYLTVASDAKYDGVGKRAVIQELFGNKTLGDAGKPVLVTSYDLARRETLLLRSTKFPNMLAADAGDGTSAAPTYFPPIKTKEGWWLIDGGVTVNNASMCAYAEAKRMWPDEEIVMLNVGTGHNETPINGQEAVEYGALGWMNEGNIMGITMDNDVVVKQCQLIFGDKYLNVDSPVLGNFPTITKYRTESQWVWDWFSSGYQDVQVPYEYDPNPSAAMDDISLENIADLKLLGQKWFDEKGQAALNLIK